MPLPDPIQAQLIAARRTQILDAAIQVFAEKGFHGATIKEIAQRAGIADGTIYNYFANKTALLVGILDRLNETPERAEHFAQAPQGDMAEWLRAYIRQRMALFGPEVQQMFRAILPELLVNPEVREQYVKQVLEPTYAIATPYFQQWIAQGQVKALEPALVMRLVAGAFFGMLMLRLLGDTELETRWDAIPDLLAEVILNGLAQGGKDGRATNETDSR
jgi:AcrR family transcriptional regulator